MKRFFFLLFFLSSISMAQELRRIVVLPFNASTGIEAYGLGLATALQRSLNVLDGVYVPPIGDTWLFMQQLYDEDRVSVDTIATAFETQVIISGQLTASGSAGEVLLGFAGPAYPEIKDVAVDVHLDTPDDILARVVDAIIAELALGVNSQDRQELDAVIAQLPSVPSLSSVSLASLRLPSTNLSDLDAASQLDGDSSWVLAEYARGLALSGQLAKAAELAAQAVALAPNDIEAQVIQGIINQGAGNQEVAKGAFESALAINPVHPYALTGKGSLTGDTVLLESAISTYPQLVDAYLALANLQAKESAQEALQTIRRGTSKNPSSVALHRAFMQEALRLNDPAGALAYLKDTVAAQLAPSAGLYSLAALIPSDFATDSLILIREGRSRYPENPTLALAEADVLERQADLASAETILQDALNANPGHVDIVNKLAILQAKQGKLDAARATFALVQGQSDTVDSNLAQLFLQIGENQAAASALEPLIQKYPNDAELKAYYGIALGRLGQFDAAMAALDQALAIKSDLELALQAKSQLQEERNLTGGQTVQLSPEASAAFSEGLNALNQKDYATAAEAFSRARALQDDGLVAFYQGLSLYLSGQSREAVPAFSRALEAFPENDIILNDLGLVQLDLGRFDLALDYLKRALAKNPQNDQAHLNLGLTHYRLGQYAEAINSWETALQLKPELETSVADLLSEARSRAAE
jgi:tetratricopeptide (TPR) repeat protein